MVTDIQYHASLQKSDLYLAQGAINAARVVLLESCHIHAAVCFLFFPNKCAPSIIHPPTAPCSEREARALAPLAFQHTLTFAQTHALKSITQGSFMSRRQAPPLSTPPPPPPPLSPPPSSAVLHHLPVLVLKAHSSRISRFYTMIHVCLWCHLRNENPCMSKASISCSFYEYIYKLISKFSFVLQELITFENIFK